MAQFVAKMPRYFDDRLKRPTSVFNFSPAAQASELERFLLKTILLL
jgi:hypothetical protein